MPKTVGQRPTDDVVWPAESSQARMIDRQPCGRCRITLDGVRIDNHKLLCSKIVRIVSFMRSNCLRFRIHSDSKCRFSHNFMFNTLSSVLERVSTLLTAQGAYRLI